MKDRMFFVIVAAVILQCGLSPCTSNAAWIWTREAGVRNVEAPRSPDANVSRAASETLIADIDFSSRFPDSFRVSPNGRRVAYLTQAGDKQSAVVDGKEGREYDGIGTGTLIFSPDSKRQTYSACVGEKWLVVVDGKEGKPYDGIAKGTPIFSPDSKCVAYGASIGNKRLVVVDGKEGKRYDDIIAGTLTFGPDGKWLAYAAQLGDRQFVVANGTEGKPIQYHRYRGPGRHHL